MIPPLSGIFRTSSLASPSTRRKAAGDNYSPSTKL